MFTPSTVTDLLEKGVCVFPVLTPDQTTLFRNAFQQVQTEFPEFRHTVEASSLPYVLGGFGAYGNPSSFHNGYIRSLRLLTAEPMIRLFQAVACTMESVTIIDPLPPPPGRWYFEQLFDRMCCRPKGSSTSPESVHRDLNPQTVIPTGTLVHIPAQNKKNKVPLQKERYIPRPWDYCFGGWINLDEEGDQYFSCVLGSHKHPITMFKGTSESGFDTRESLTGPIHRISVPSGHAVIFFQRIQHIVTPSKRKTDSYRQFRCYRLFRSAETDPSPLNGQRLWDECINTFAVPKLPSGQIPPMYGSNHQSMFLLKGTRSDPAWWSTRKFPTDLLQTRTVRSGRREGLSYRIIPRFMSSLREYPMEMVYPPYKQWEKNMLKPSFQWTIPDKDCLNTILSTVDGIVTLSILDERRLTWITLSLV